MNRQTIKHDQSGLVSIVIALVIMSVLTLVAVSFAYLARREQRQALDRQLSSQAFYAAETGVNDAVTAVPTLGDDVTDCSDAEQDQIMSNNSDRQLDASTGVEYTCVLVDRSPRTLVYDSIDEDGSIVVRIRTTQDVEDLRISWEDTDAGPDWTGSFSNSEGHFYLPQEKAQRDQAVSSFLNTNEGAQTADFPNHIGMLRATIIPTNEITSTNSLLENSQTVFLYPDQNEDDDTGEVGDVNFRNSAQLSREGVFGSGECHADNGAEGTDPDDFPRDCNTDIEDVDSRDFYLRLRAIYRPVAVTITSRDDDGDLLRMQGAQAIVDSTGKANDVLRRIQVRVPYQTDFYYPEFAVESANSICKRGRVGGPDGMELLSPLVTAPWLYQPGSWLDYNGGEINNRDADELACHLPTPTDQY